MTVRVTEDIFKRRICWQKTLDSLDGYVKEEQEQEKT